MLLWALRMRRRRTPGYCGRRGETPPPQVSSGYLDLARRSSKSPGRPASPWSRRRSGGAAAVSARPRAVIRLQQVAELRRGRLGAITRALVPRGIAAVGDRSRSCEGRRVDAAERFPPAVTSMGETGYLEPGGNHEP